MPTVGCLERPGMSKYTSFILPYQQLDVGTEKEKKGQVCLFLSGESRHKCLRKGGPAGMWFLLLKTDRDRYGLTEETKQNSAQFFSRGWY